jgi:hypothetical protein
MRRLVAAALLVLTACSDSTGPNAHVGSYTLVSVNGQGLPEVVFQDGSETVEFTGGVVTLNSNGTFSDRIDFRITTSTEVFDDSDTITGTYTITGNNVTLNPSDGSSAYSMALSGNALTQVEPGLTLVYEK